jgi:uncharacterized protein (DUF433 family)
VVRSVKTTISYPHVAKTPGVCGGKAQVEGTRIRVHDVAFLHKEGASDSRVREEYPDLTPAQVHAALAYYYDNREEIDAELREGEQFFADAERKWDELVAGNGGQPPSNPTPEERAIPRPFPWTPEK